MVKLQTLMVLMLAVFVAACTQGAESPETPTEQPPTEPSAPAAPEQEATSSVTVNGEVISADEITAVEQSLTQQGQQVTRDQVVEELINQRLLSQAVESQGIIVSDEEAETNIESQLTQQGATLDDYKAQLESQGISYDAQLENVKEDLATQQYLNQALEGVNFEVTDAEVQEFYTLYQQQNPEAPSIEELEADIVITLEQQKQQEAVAALLQELRAQANIEYN